MTSTKTRLSLSQSSFQDFRECPRRFQLKVVENTTWPAAALEPLSQLERYTDLGNKFHQISNQFFSGIPSNIIKANITDPDIKLMWENFIPFAEELADHQRYSEIILTSPFLGHEIVAKYDLVVQTPEGKFIIYDWKTAATKPSRTILGQRFQTILYPLILVRAGKSLFKSTSSDPGDISMHYWYAMSSDPEEIFPYSDEIHTKNVKEITKIVTQIDDFITGGTSFPLTDELSHCQKCVYRSLCERGNQSASFDQYTDIENEDLSNQHFDFNTIDEIEI